MGLKSFLGLNDEEENNVVETESEDSFYNISNNIYNHIICYIINFRNNRKMYRLGYTSPAR